MSLLDQLPSMQSTGTLPKLRLGFLEQRSAVRLRATRRALQSSCCHSALISDFLLDVQAVLLVYLSSLLLASFAVQPRNIALVLIIKVLQCFKPQGETCSCKSPGGV